MQLFEKYRHSRMYTLFNFSDDMAKGRSCIMLYNSVSSMITWMTTGLFYTSFLMANGIDLVNINILTFVPYIASCFAIFAPMILERFQRRKWILVGIKLLSDGLNLLGVTLLPIFVHDPQLKVTCFVLLVFLSHIANSITSSGFQAWHIRFIPEPIRADYFAINNFMLNLLGISAALVSGVIADALSGSPYENAIIVAFRYAAFGLSLLNAYALSRPKEFAYERSKAKVRLLDIFVLPVKNSKFLLTMGIVALLTLTSSLPAASLNYYLLDDVHMNYTFNNILNVLYPPIVLLLMAPWKKVLQKIGWWKLYALCALLYAPTVVMTGFVTAGNYLWLYALVRILQHIVGVGQNLATSNVLYINLPDTDQTNYLSFYTLVSNAAAFGGMMFGTWFGEAFETILVSLPGFSFGNAQLLQIFSGAGMFLVPLFVMLLFKRLNPDDPNKQYG